MDKIFDSFQGDSPVLQTIGKYGYVVYEDRERIFMYTHLLISALFPIFIGSQASLHRPPSAKAPTKSKKTGKDGDEDEDDLEVEPTVEGLSPSDAILFPVLAGITLGVLYFIIKVLKKPALLNKILNYYFSAIGVFGVGRLTADGLNVLTSLVFPNVWASRSTTYYIDPLLSQQVTGEVKPARTQVHRKFTDKSNPLPGVFSSIPLPPSVNKTLWSIRALLKKHWILRAYFHGIVSTKSKIVLNDITGLLFGLVTVIIYNTASKPWWLTNLIAFGFCYSTLQLLSTTTFFTGSLVLGGLFIYDIIMVFYTPLMVTVATELDVPIKLSIPGPKRGAMLGLGDVVLPGIMIALALRFDLYLHYLYLRPTSSSPRKTYIEATSTWGDRFWTRSLPPTSPPLDTEITNAPGGRFKRTYFYASLIGYTIALLVTLVVLNVFNHAQPALLYLVPGVLIALWGTAVVRGEVGEMWKYTEDGSLDIPGEGEETAEDVAKEKLAKEEKEKNPTEKEHAHHVFLFSLSEPRGGGKKVKKEDVREGGRFAVGVDKGRAIEEL